MDIADFLKKDIVTFLENSSKYGTAENKAVEAELSSLLSSNSSSTVISDSKEQQAPVEQTVNVTIAQDMVKQAIEDLKAKPDLKNIDVPEINQKSIEPEIPLSNESEKNIPVTEKSEKELRPEELGELEKQIIDLNGFIKKSNVSEVLKIYNRLKLLVLTVTLEREVQGRLYTVLKDAAIFLSKNKLSANEIKKPKTQKEKISSLESHEKEHEIPVVESTDNFHMPSYVKALKAIKEHDKVTALELLVSLSKQHPKNRAIKMRLREALYL